jgi:hypothetical protein
MDATDLKLLDLAGISAGETYSEERNPLDCDSLALRLAVKLRMHVEPWGAGASSVVFIDNRAAVAEPHYGDDPYAATRRAIVRAAAEIGRAMK